MEWNAKELSRGQCASQLTVHFDLSDPLDTAATCANRERRAVQATCAINCFRPLNNTVRRLAPQPLRS